MEEQIRNDLMVELFGKLSCENINVVLNALSVVIKKYDISIKETSVVPYEYSMPELVKTYIVSRGVEGLSKLSLKNYVTILRLFFSTVQKAPDKVTTNDIRLFLYKYQEQSGVSNRTLDGYRVVINGFFQWASLEGYIDNNPCFQVKPIKYTKKPRKAMSQIELEYIRGACEDDRESAIVEVLYSTGCRVSELSNLKLSDINLENGEVQLFGKGSKYRTSYLNAKAIYCLRKYLETRGDCSDEHLFVSERKPHIGIKKSGIERIITKISDKAFENTGVRVTPHIFRHTCATVSLANGADVTQIQKLLGHSNISTTMIYATVQQKDVAMMHSRCVI